MAVYTKLSIEEISNITKHYKLGNLETYQGIEEGIENTNYLLVTSKEKYILTIFEKRVNEKDIPFFVNVMKYLNRNSFFCPNPIEDMNGNLINEIKKKKYIVVNFLDGKGKIKPTTKDCISLGKTLADMHNKTKNFTEIRNNSLSIDGWERLYKKICKDISKVELNKLDKLLLFDMEERLNFCYENWPKNLPKGFIHGDIFPDNVFFKNNEICGIIDFYFSCTDFLIYEIAIALNAWCFDNEKKFNFEKAQSLVKGYNSKKKITIKELKAISILSQGASLRFLLTRLYDWFNTPKEAILNKKNPLEYLNKLRFFRDNNFENELLKGD